MALPTPPVLQEVRAFTDAAGLNLQGVLCADQFDKCQPRGRRARELLHATTTILVLGSGGSTFWRKTCEHLGEKPKAGRGHHPMRRRAREVLAELVERLIARGYPSLATYPEQRNPLNFTQLGEMAGLGTVSPVLGQLLHPEFGPWVSFRGAVLIVGDPFGAAERRPAPLAFQPCASCKRPCIEACPVNVYDGAGDIAFHRCAEHRDDGGCHGGCDARRACPVGAEHRYGADEEAFRHHFSLAPLRRYHGLGVWRLVPGTVRRRL